MGWFVLLMNTSSLGICGADIWAFWRRKKGETGSWSSLHPEVGEMSRYQVAHLEHQGMTQQASPPSLSPSYGSPTALASCRCPEEDCPLLQPILSIWCRVLVAVSRYPPPTGGLVPFLRLGLGEEVGVYITGHREGVQTSKPGPLWVPAWSPADGVTLRT